MNTFRPIRDLRVGSVLRGVYRLEHLLGRGATGSVYRAVNQKDGSLAAVKVLRAGGLSLSSADTAMPGSERSPDEERNVRRFAREARIIATMNHPNIVKIFAFERADGEEESFIAMELLDGEPLAQLLKRRHLAPEEALALYEPLCGAMNYAHDQGIVHRDLKPDNVFLVGARLDNPRVLDFGISKVLLPDASQLTTDAILGTPAYMAPELVRAPALVDRRADIFALGAMLFHCLTGRLPFEGETVLAVLHKILSEYVPSARQHVPELSPELDAVLQRALRYDPRDRYQEAADLLAALRQAVTEVPVRLSPSPTALMPIVQAPSPSTQTPRSREAVAQTLMMPVVPPPAERPPRHSSAVLRLDASGPSGVLALPPQPGSGATPALREDDWDGTEPGAQLSLAASGGALRWLGGHLPARWLAAALLGGAVGAGIGLWGLLAQR